MVQEDIAQLIHRLPEDVAQAVIVEWLNLSHQHWRNLLGELSDLRQWVHLIQHAQGNPVRVYRQAVVQGLDAVLLSARQDTIVFLLSKITL